MESHYCRKDTARLYLDNFYKSAKDVYRDYLKCMKERYIPANERASYGFLVFKLEKIFVIFVLLLKIKIYLKTSIIII